MKVLMTACALFFSAVVSAAPLNNIVVFGDSLSDNGNLYEYMGHSVPVSPPYYEGRFTNGPVWVERLAATYFGEKAKAHLLDFAFGGAGISENSEDDVLFTLEREIDSYLLAHGADSAQQSLFIVWIGANNYLGIPDDPENNVKMVNEGIRHGLERLVKAGAKHILVLNLPDLGKTPGARDMAMEQELSEYSNSHNQLLASTVANLQKEYPEVQWLSYDVNNMVNLILDNPAKFGFNNTNETCYKVSFKPQRSRQSVLKMAAIVPSEAVSDCEGYLFFDPVHPTTAAHQMMSDAAKMLLDANGIEFTS